MDLKAWSLISGFYQQVTLKDKAHIYIRQKSAPWEVFFIDPVSEGNMLDYGCGHGVLLAMFSRLRPHLKLFGIDHDKRKIQVLKAALPNVQIMEQEDFPKFSSFFDYVVVCDMLYCNNPKEQSRILVKICNSLKPGGKILIKETVSIPKIKYYLIQFHELIVMRMLKLTKGANLNIPHPDHYINILKASGFEILESRPVDKGFLHPHYMFYAKKPIG